MRSRRINLGFDRFSGLYLWAVFIIVFGLWKTDLFFTSDTLHSVASQYAVTAMLGIAVLVPLAAGVFDLSIGATITMSTIVVAQLQSKNHWGIVPAIIAAVLVGLLIGVVNGFLVVVLKISSFIATLATTTIIGAAMSIYTNQTQPLPPTSQTWLDLSQKDVFGFQMIVVALLVLAIIFWWVLDHTPAGRYIYAVGGNPEAARLSGVRVGKWVWLSFIVSGTVSGIAGVFYCSQTGPSFTFGAALLLPAYAAAFLGSTQVRPGRFNVWGAMIAVYVLATGVKGLSFVTSAQWLNDMFNGVTLVAACAFAVWRQSKAANKRRLGLDTGPSVETPQEADSPAAEVSQKEGPVAERVTTEGGSAPPHHP